MWVGIRIYEGVWKGSWPDQKVISKEKKKTDVWSFGKMVWAENFLVSPCIYVEVDVVYAHTHTHNVCMYV